MFEGLNVNVRDLRVTHSQQVLGLFEPVNAVLFLNVSDAHFNAWREDFDCDRQLTETFWHEAYHCFQVYCSGFCLAHCMRLAEIFSRQTSNGPLLRMVGHLVGGAMVDRMLDAPGILLSGRARAMLTEARRLRTEARRAESLAASAKRSGQKSVWGSLNPRLHASLHAAGEQLRVRGCDGISAEDVIEGAAFLYGRDHAFGAESPVAHLQAASADADGCYGRLVMSSVQSCPGCSSAQIRAAAALALRYEQPGHAFLPLLRSVCAGADATAAARALAHDLPGLQDAGARLGTAVEIRGRHPKEGYAVYDHQLMRLARWPVDEIDVLVDTDAAAEIPTGQFGFTLVTQGGPRGPKDPHKGHAAVLLASLLLPTGPSVADLRRSMMRSL